MPTGSVALDGVAVQKFAKARVRSAFADRERDIRGIGGDFLATDGYQIAEGRNFTADDMERAAAGRRPAGPEQFRLDELIRQGLSARNDPRSP